MTLPILAIEVREDRDVVLARQRARQAAECLGFDLQDQTRVATAVSEVARDVFQASATARIEILIEDGDPSASLSVRVRDPIRGAADLQAALDGRSAPAEGSAMGLIGARKLVDRFAIEPAPGGGAVVQMAKALPRKHAAITPTFAARVAEKLAGQSPGEPLEVLRQQNEELLRALVELRSREGELAQLNGELEETNRGVVALYAELDERANSLKKASELKSRFLSNVSHEFRSPLNSILSLARFLLDRTDGDLTGEQERQVSLIRKAAEGLSGLVNDLLDLAKVEAGKIVVRPETFAVADLFGTLRGMIRPLLDRDSVALVFEEPVGIPPMWTDEGKVAQILRNFLSNAVKYTEQGEIRVTAKRGDGDTVIFSVSDTGLGIAPEDRERIFEEFAQVEGPHQKRIRGTGLGLPLSRKLAELLGGGVLLESEPGVGSTFTLVVPREYEAAPGSGHPREPEAPAVGLPQAAAARVGTILVIDDTETDRYLLRIALADLGHGDVIEAARGEDGLRLARERQPSVIFLDLVMPEMTGPEVLDRLRSEPATATIPVIFHSSKALDDEDRRRLDRPNASFLPKGFASREEARVGVGEALEKTGLSGGPAREGASHA
jgi:signal transduction histidine kinase/CheY-like chemotaxis protein